jgi:hypothetical protein
MQDSHTHVPADDTAGDSSRLRLMPASTAGLPEWLAGRVDEHLAVFAAHMTQGCWPPRPRSAWRSWPS